jgi:hypothetical protein
MQENNIEFKADDNIVSNEYVAYKNRCSFKLNKIIPEKTEFYISYIVSL